MCGDGLGDCEPHGMESRECISEREHEWSAGERQARELERLRERYRKRWRQRDERI